MSESGEVGNQLRRSLGAVHLDRSVVDVAADLVAIAAAISLTGFRDPAPERTRYDIANTRLLP